MAIPFVGKEFEFMQPDGTALNVKGWGNQYNAVFEALNGFTLVQDPVTGFFQYADVSPDGSELIPSGGVPRRVNPRNLGLTPEIRVSDLASKAKVFESPGLTPGTSRWEQRRRERRLSLRTSLDQNALKLAPPQRETVGEFVGLCLLVEFPDVPATIPADEVEKFCNRIGYSGFGNNGSVFDYFFASSKGRLQYRNIVAPYYRAAHPLSYYTNEAVDQPVRARQLIKEALDYHRGRGFDFSQLSADNKQYVYATNVFYSGTRVNNWAKGLWPHSFHLQTPYQLAPGKYAFDYQITDMTSRLSLGTFCHENGHMICDFPDLYDYGYESAGVGAYCLMCAGANVNELNPTEIGAYLKYKAGWAQSLTPISNGLNGTAEAGANRFFIHRKDASEYFIIENRHQDGRDLSLPSAGLAIWHVDELGDNQNEQMTPDLHYECSLVQADGRFDLERDPRNIGDRTDLFSRNVNGHFGNTTNPNSGWWDGTVSGLDIGDIGSPGASISFSGRV